MQVTIEKVGNGAGIILPPDLLERLRLKEGDKVELTETTDGISISARDEDMEETLEIARHVMREDRDLLKKLAE